MLKSDDVRYIPVMSGKLCVVVVPALFWGCSVAILSRLLFLDINHPALRNSAYLLLETLPAIWPQPASALYRPGAPLDFSLAARPRALDY